MVGCPNKEKERTESPEEKEGTESPQSPQATINTPIHKKLEKAQSQKPA
jgi:hypothetical protein